jgi:hypothetical protein
MIRIIFIVSVTVIFLTIVSSCEKNPAVGEENIVPRQIFDGALIVNEGVFQQGNATLSFFEHSTGMIYNNIFKQQNNEHLGDVANSIIIRDSLAYLVINNSDKIEVIRTDDFKRQLKITLPAGTSPRYIAFGDSAELLVTSLYKASVLIVDRYTGNVEGDIPVGENPEAIIRVGDKVFVANSGFGSGRTVSVITLPDKHKHPDIQVGDNPRFLRMDKSRRLHVLCSGAYNDWNDPADDTPGGIWIIDPFSETVTDSLLLPPGKHPGKFDIAGDGTGYITVNDRIWTYNTQTLAVRTQDLTGDVPMTPYAVRFNADENLLYVLDAVDYVGSGKLFIFNPAGSLTAGPFQTGVIPSDLDFIYKEADQ